MKENAGTVTFPQLQVAGASQQATKKIQHQSLELALEQTQQKIVYSFDHVFLPVCKQADVFAEIKPFVQAALDGENTCIFAYGQTGSGKTHTMEGPSYDQFYDFETSQLTDCSGILPRLAEYIW
jgi:chromosomal replication initiation ATPase DnaA